LIYPVRKRDGLSERTEKKIPVSWLGIGLALGAEIGLALDEMTAGMGLGGLSAALMDRQRKKKQDQDEGRGEEL